MVVISTLCLNCQGEDKEFLRRKTLPYSYFLFPPAPRKLFTGLQCNMDNVLLGERPEAPWEEPGLWKASLTRPPAKADEGARQSLG